MKKEEQIANIVDNEYNVRFRTLIEYKEFLLEKGRANCLKEVINIMDKEKIAINDAWGFYYNDLKQAILEGNRK